MIFEKLLFYKDIWFILGQLEIFISEILDNWFNDGSSDYVYYICYDPRMSLVGSYLLSNVILFKEVFLYFVSFIWKSYWYSVIYCVKWNGYILNGWKNHSIKFIIKDGMLLLILLFIR